MDLLVRRLNFDLDFNHQQVKSVELVHFEATASAVTPKRNVVIAHSFLLLLARQIQKQKLILLCDLHVLTQYSVEVGYPSKSKKKHTQGQSCDHSVAAATDVRIVCWKNIPKPRCA
ncbi:unnamed protein product [Ceratitis capitata]|uniref:(Mediterranean fruit fly) hypothetical protein n=1 Tax=Ceratitis capitata TaxID=7213 RepID=A0A811U6G3_CERCA|nr:unnamed protein product [Ceratitis capitata]